MILTKIISRHHVAPKEIPSFRQSTYSPTAPRTVVLVSSSSQRIAFDYWEPFQPAMSTDISHPLPLIPPHWLIQRYPSLLDSRWDNSALWYNYALKLFCPKCSSHMWLLRLWTWLVGTEMCGKYKIQRFQKLKKKECKMCHSCFKVVIIHYNDTIVYIWDSIKYIETDFTCFFSHSMLLLGYLVGNFHSCMSQIKARLGPPEEVRITWVEGGQLPRGRSWFLREFPLWTISWILNLLTKERLDLHEERSYNAMKKNI